MQRRGVSLISYFQVNNPLVKPFDPLFIGLHAQSGSQMSTKVTPKANDLEWVGNVCRSGDRVMMIEYSELPEALARQRNANRRCLFDAANLAVHPLDVAFVQQIGGRSFELPFRRSRTRPVSIRWRRHGAIRVLAPFGSWNQPACPFRADPPANLTRSSPSIRRSRWTRKMSRRRCDLAPETGVLCP